MQNRSSRRRLLAAVTAATAAAAFAPAASAEASLRELGTLTCSVLGEAPRADSGTPAEMAQGRAALCRFRPGDSGPEETYTATLKFIGQKPGGPDLNKTLMLVVKVPFSVALASGLLEQTYAADASTAAGRAGPLIGQRNSSFVLHPEPDAPNEPTLALGKTDLATLMVAELKLLSSPA
jgi:hypothetical protein